MAKELDEFESLLVPQFLIDDDDMFSELRGSEKRNAWRNGNNLGFGMSVKQDFGCGFGEFGPFGSFETESDEDDYVYATELSRTWSQSSLRESTTAFESKLGWGLSGSPELTQSGALGGGKCRCIRCYSRGSPTRLSHVTSPTGRNVSETAAWELLRAAAGEIARLKMMEELAGFHLNSNNRGPILPTPKKPSPVSVPQKHSACQNLTHLSYQHRVKALQFQLLRQQQQQLSERSEKKFQLSQTQLTLLKNGGGKSTISMGTSAWPSFEQTTRHPQEANSGMRAAFIENPVSKRGRAGTGVFLPRGTGSSAPARKKPAAADASAVLLEDRVVLPRNGKLEAMNSSPAQPKYEAPEARYRNDRLMSQLRSSSVKQFPAVKNRSQEIQLPQDWTY